MSLSREQREQELRKLERIDALELALNYFVEDEVSTQGLCACSLCAQLLKNLPRGQVCPVLPGFGSDGVICAVLCDMRYAADQT